MGSNPTFPMNAAAGGATPFAAGPLRGELRVAGDKSISHRALMLGAAARGTTRIIEPNRGADVLTTRDAVVALGAHVTDDGDDFVVTGGTLRDPAQTIDARNSGTTTRLLAGLCAGSGVTATFDGDDSLRRRPMERVARALRALGAVVETAEGRLPITVRGISNLAGGTYALEVPSAQIKSAILLAHLRATERVVVTGDARSRDHTERMLAHFGRTILFDGRATQLEPGRLVARDVRVPGDLSAAAFFLIGATVARGSNLLLRDVGVNPTRTGVLDALVAMGGDVTIERARERDGEPVADLRVRSAPLRAIEIDGAYVVRAIDEIPVLAVAAAFATGTTHIRDAAELRAKESDRLRATAIVLRACGIEVTEHPDGLDIVGGAPQLPETPLPVFDDHRIAMAIAVLAAGANGGSIERADAIAVSFPEFADRWSGAQRGRP